jgi:choline-sulfatase
LAPNDISLKPWIQNPENTQGYGPVYAEYGLKRNEPKAMLREGEWKFTYWLNDIPQLYNLQSDLDELHNLAGVPEHRARVDRRQQQLLARHSPTRDRDSK